MPNTIRRGFFNKFNRGEVGRDAFAREDIPRVDNACESMVNFMPQRLGPMFYRPGTEYLDSAGSILDDSILVPFITEQDDALLCIFELSQQNVRFFKTNVDDDLKTQNDNLITWINGPLNAPGTGWTNADEGTATSVFGGTNLLMTGTSQDAAIVYQDTAVFTAGQKYTLRISIDEGSCRVTIGDAAGPIANQIFDQVLTIGRHFITITAPTTGTLSLSLINDDRIPCLIQEAEFDVPPDTVISYPVANVGYPNSAFAGPDTFEELRTLRWAQSADVMYFCGRYWLPFTIKRWNTDSVSIELFQPLFGPYKPINITGTQLNAVSGTSLGDDTVFSSRNIFIEGGNSVPGAYGHDAGVTTVKLALQGQGAFLNTTTDGEATSSVFVFGNGSGRDLNYNISPVGGNFTLIRVEKSFDNVTWTPEGTTFGPAGAIAGTFNDGLDGAEIYYRLALVTLAPATSVVMQLQYDFGTTEAEGHVRELDSIGTLDELHWYEVAPNNNPTEDWFLGEWGGEVDTLPTALAFTEGRLWFAGQNKVWGSESDFYRSFDEDIEGASASINKTIGFGASSQIRWLAPSARLVLGTDTNEIDVRSTTFGEVLTPLNTNLKIGSDLGCADVPPIVLDQEIMFVQRGGNKLIGIDFSIQSESHAIVDFNMMNNEVLEPGVARIAFVRNPETRVFLVMNDGTMRIMLRDKYEEVLGWSQVEIYQPGDPPTLAEVIDIAIVPGDPEDRIYLLVQNPLTPAVAELMKFAQTEEAEGQSDSKHYDFFETFTSPGTTIQMNAVTYQSGDVIGVWVDGQFDGEYTLDVSRQATGITSGTNVVAGTRYPATYKSNKLSDYDDIGVMGQRRRIINTGLIMRNYYVDSNGLADVFIGFDETERNMPLLEAGTTVTPGTKEEYDFFPFEFPGASETDPRLFIEANGPVKILAYGYDIKDTARKTKGG